MIEDDLVIIAKKEPETAINTINFLIEQFENYDNFFIKSHSYERMLLLYRNLNEQYQKQVESKMNNVCNKFNILYKESKNLSSNDLSKSIKEYDDFLEENRKKFIDLDEKNLQVINNSQQYIFNSSMKFNAYAEIHSKNLKIIKGILESCKKGLYKLKNDINKLSRKNIYPDDVYRWEFNKIISISAWLRYCIEIVVWWTIKYSSDETLNNFLKKIKNNKYRTGKLFEIYKNDPNLNIEIWSFCGNETDLILMKKLPMNIWKDWEKENIKKIYDKLSSLIHYDFLENINDEANSFSNKTEILFKGNFEKLEEIIFNKKKYMQDSYDYLEKIYKFIYESLRNHVIKFNNSEFVIFVKEFEIDYSKTLNNVKFEEFEG